MTTASFLLCLIFILSPSHISAQTARVTDTIHLGRMVGSGEAAFQIERVRDSSGVSRTSLLVVIADGQRPYASSVVRIPTIYIDKLEQAAADFRRAYRLAEASPPDGSRQVDMAVLDLHIGLQVNSGNPESWLLYLSGGPPFYARAEFRPGDIWDIEQILQTARKSVGQLR